MRKQLNPINLSVARTNKRALKKFWQNFIRCFIATVLDFKISVELQDFFYFVLTSLTVRVILTKEKTKQIHNILYSTTTTILNSKKFTQRHNLNINRPNIHNILFCALILSLSPQQFLHPIHFKFRFWIIVSALHPIRHCNHCEWSDTKIHWRLHSTG